MTYMKKKAVFIALAILAALLMALAAGCTNSNPPAQITQPNQADSPNAAAYDTLKAATGEQNPDGGGISVSGQGTVSVKPDVATVMLGVETMDADAAKARAANDEAMAKVIAAVKGFGVTDDDIKTANFNIYPRYDDKGQKVTGYTVSNTVSVRVKDLDKLGEVLNAASTAGANTAGGISFDVLDRTAAYNQALAQAMDKAKARAEIMAKACGVTLGKVLTINESSSYSGPIFAANEGMVADKAGGSVPVSSGQMDVTASVSVMYEIVK